MEVNFPYDIKWEVINFRAIVIRDGKVVADEVCRGDMLTENLQALIRDLPGHSTVVFDNVVVTSVVGTRVLKGFTVIIRDEETEETVYDEDNLRLKVLDSATGDLVLPVRYSDNWFFLLPGESKTVDVSFESVKGKPVFETEGLNL